MLKWRGVVLFFVLILIGTCVASPATRKDNKTKEKCLFNDESYEMKIIHVYVCPQVNITLERKSTRSHAVITIEPRENEISEKEQDDTTVLRLSETPKSIKNWEKMESFRVFIYDIEFESEKETLINIFKEMGIDSRKIDHLEVSQCPGFGLIHIKNMDQLWSLTVYGVLEGVDSQNYIGDTLPQLRSLFLYEIEIDTMPSLKRLKYLEEFNVECNLCDEIPEEYFADNAMVTMIEIIAPAMTKIGQDFCQNMKNLETLYIEMSDAKLPSLTDCEALREFSIFNLDGDDRIRTMKRQSPDLAGLKQLRSLMLQNSGIETIPVEIIKANPHLYDINLSYNYITEVPSKSFAHLSDLQALDLSGNNISMFSDAYVPETLIYLNIKESLLREYAPTKTLSRLYALQLSDNQLSGCFVVKPFIESYPALFLFDLRNNYYTSVSLAGPFYAKEDSIEIDLSYNRIVTVKIDPKTVGSKTTDDETRVSLDLSGNVLRCDCHLKPFVEALRKKNSNIYLITDVKCSGSNERTLKTIELDEMKC